MPIVKLFKNNNIPIELSVSKHAFDVLAYVQQYLRANFNGFELTIDEKLLNDALKLRYRLICNNFSE